VRNPHSPDHGNQWRIYPFLRQPTTIIEALQPEMVRQPVVISSPVSIHRMLTVVPTC